MYSFLINKNMNIFNEDLLILLQLFFEQKNYINESNIVKVLEQPIFKQDIKKHKKYKKSKIIDTNYDGLKKAFNIK